MFCFSTPKKKHHCVQPIRYPYINNSTYKRVAYVITLITYQYSDNYKTDSTVDWVKQAHLAIVSKNRPY